MSRTTLAGAKAELVALLNPAGVPFDSRVTIVYDHEPAPGQMSRPVAVTISTAAMEPDYWIINVRLYVDCSSDPAVAQATADELMVAIDDRLTSGFGPSDWTAEYDVEIDAWVATDRAQVGREGYGW